MYLLGPLKRIKNKFDDSLISSVVIAVILTWNAYRLALQVNQWISPRLRLFFKALREDSKIIGKFILKCWAEFWLLGAGVEFNKPEWVRLALHYGANPNGGIGYLRGWSALHSAAALGLLPIVELLLDAGADLDPVSNNHYSLTPLDLALRYDRRHIVEHLLARRLSLIQVSATLNRAQSTHDTLSHFFSSITAKALKEYYAKDDLSVALKECVDYCQTLSQTDHIESAAKRCVAWLSHSDFQDFRSQVRLPEALALAWLAVHDINALKADKIVLKADDIPSRRQTLIQHLYFIQREYNLNETAQDDQSADSTGCISGAFNQIMSALTGAHSSACFYYLNNESLTLLFKSKIAEWVKTLEHPDLAQWTRETGMPKSLIRLFRDSTVPQEIKQEIKGLKSTVGTQLKWLYADHVSCASCEQCIENYKPYVNDRLALQDLIKKSKSVVNAHIKNLKYSGPILS